jgi:hypothetical protein
MRHALHIAMVAGLVLGSLGCGELQNAPFRIGTVKGQLTQSDASVALVAVLGAPQVRSSVAPDGSFTLEQVPAGRAELFIVASASKTLRVPVLVPGGQSVSVGPLEPKEASFLVVRLKAPAHESVSQAQVTLVGTPLEPLQPDMAGRVSMGPLPEGCYTLSIVLSGFPVVTSEVCVSAGALADVKVNLPPPDSGCAVTGCSDDFLCVTDGRCVECLEDAQCGTGLSCRGMRCEGEGPVCSSCEGDWQCRANASCQELPDGTSACVESCANLNTCGNGFTCQADRCLPDTAQFNGCQAYRMVGATCDSQARCQSAGLINGLCVSGRCTIPCDSGRECPEFFSCETLAEGRVCVPNE